MREFSGWSQKAENARKEKQEEEDKEINTARELPLGWRVVGKEGPKNERLAYVGEVWTDMRSLSPWQKMEEMEHEKQVARLQELSEIGDVPVGSF